MTVHPDSHRRACELLGLPHDSSLTASQFAEAARLERSVVLLGEVEVPKESRHSLLRDLLTNGPVSMKPTAGQRRALRGE